jgi:anti-sigma B factor antagonist
MEFSSTVALDAPCALVVGRGELDALSGLPLRRRLDAAVDRGCIDFGIDVEAVTFVDAGGLGMLVRLQNTVAPYGGSVSVVAASPRFCQVAELGGLGHAFDLDLLAGNPLRRAASA